MKSNDKKLWLILGNHDREITKRVKDFKKFETLSDEEKDLYCKILFDGIYELFENDEDKRVIKDLIKILYIFLDCFSEVNLREVMLKI